MFSTDYIKEIYLKDGNDQKSQRKRYYCFQWTEEAMTIVALLS